MTHSRLSSHGTTTTRLPGRSRPLRWRAAATALALSAVPGWGHLYAGEIPRGSFVAAGFLAVVWPLAVLCCVVWSFSAAAPLWIGGVLFGLSLLSGLPPAGRLLLSRTPRCDLSGEPVPHSGASAIVFAAHGFLCLSLLVIETVWLLAGSLAVAPVRTDALLPELESGTEVRTLVSTYIQPVHGDVVLLAERVCDRCATGAPERILARVLAKPGDTVERSGSTLIVNGIEVDDDPGARRLELEQAGRRDRRYRAIRHLFAATVDLSEGEWTGVPRRGDAWRCILPKNVYLVVPDIELERTGETEELWPVRGEEVLGRALFRR